MNTSLLRQLATALVAIGCTAAAHALTPAPTSWELSGQFGANNPNGVWQYGQKAWTGNLAPLPAFTPLPLIGSLPAGYPGNYAAFSNPLFNDLPQIGQNLNTVAWTTPTVPAFQITLPARGVQLHPGPQVWTGKLHRFQCQVATVRFTAPDSALYRVSGQFYGLNANGSKTDTTVYIVSKTPNGTGPIVHYSAAVNLTTLPQTPASFTFKLVQLKKDETLDFDVTCGANFNYQFGSTGLHAVIERAGPYCDPAVTPACQPN